MDHIETSSTRENLCTPNSSMDQITSKLVCKGLEQQKSLANFEMDRYFSEQNERFLSTSPFWFFDQINLLSKLQRYHEQHSHSLINTEVMTL
mmetsp:Transcript_26577/g.47908  ORF Transcript_26577/g.47908 Transcript_26577/m.47908 type:complete len:92 (+) Transcript_26577:158-433(+)